MRKIKTNGCFNCPFFYYDYNPETCGYSTVDICQLSIFLKLLNHTISVHNECGPNREAKTPDWCPLQLESISIEFEEFSERTIQEIEKIKKEINELEKFLDGTECSLDYNNTIIDEKSNELQKLYIKLEKLNENENEINNFKSE